MVASSGRVSVSARDVAMSLNPCGWKSATIAAISSASSCDAASVKNSCGTHLRTNSPTGSEDSRRHRASRCSQASSRSEPRHPAYVSARISVRTRSGLIRQSSCASKPPQERPKTCACSNPTASRNEVSASAQSTIVKPSGGSEEAPAPGASQATTLNSSERSSSCRRQQRESQRKPWRSTSGAPSPAER